MNKPKVLLTAFKNTSSERLIHFFDDSFAKLILENHKEYSTSQLYSELEKHRYSHVISLGQKPVIREKIYIEKKAKNGDVSYETTADIQAMKNEFEKNGLAVHLSENAGTSFCNNIYFYGLQYINDSGSDTKMVFVHIPFEKNIADFRCFSEKIISGINYYINRS